MSNMRKILSRCRYGLVVVCLLAAILPAAGCSTEETTESVVANYGTYGSKLAEQLAADYPFRSPGSNQEKAAGDFLIKAFKSLGYQPVVTEFAFTDANGNSGQSRNIAVLIKGSGFVRTDADGKTENLERQVIIGAHYDTAITADEAATAETTPETTSGGSITLSGEIEEPTLSDYDGINDNASGIGTLLTMARQIKDQKLGYDIILVAFGAGEANQAGARYYASQMGKAEIAATDAMYCIDSIYAGDKVYVHSGQNSIKANYKKDYEKRRKLYEATDVFYEYELYTNNGYMLYTNQSAIDVELEGFSQPVLYREWTMNLSDYTPFDNKGIPIVFFESYDYDEKTLEDMKESQNPAFGETGGMISHTQFDSTAFLEQILNSARSATNSQNTPKTTTDQMTRRINNTAFIILEASLKGPADSTVR